MPSLFRLGFSLVALALLCQPVLASGRYYDLENWTSAATAVRHERHPYSRFRTNLAIGGAFAPEYLGSDSNEFKILPLADVEYADALFISTQRGIGYNLWRTKSIKAGPRVTFDFGRDSQSHAEIASLPDVDPGAEVGLFLDAYGGPWRVRTDIRQEVAGGHGGWLFNFDLAWGARTSNSTSLILGGRTTYMGDDYADSYFSVAPANATSTLPAFTASSDFRDVTGYVQVIYDINQRLYLAGDGRAVALLGSAADSPVSKTDTYFVGSLMLGYRF
ncbi:MAG TPA: MipA/OmpV family protein [Alphaproteobacteria bacterium]|nr:MipA/OmpV family protein [Alphaproteobacteria bacterium]